MAPASVRPRGPPPAPARTLNQLLDEPCPAHKDMRHTLRNCRDFKAMLTHGQFPTPQPTPPPPPPRNQPPQRPKGGNNQRFPDVNKEVNFILGGHRAYASKRQQKLEDRRINAATSEPPQPYDWSHEPIFFSRADQCFNFDEPGNRGYPTQEGTDRRRDKHQRGVPWSSTRHGDPASRTQEVDTLFFGIVPGAGEYPLGHIYLPVAFGTAENFRIETLRFEVPTFNCVYNAIIGRPGLAKFMAIPHYPYLVLKMLALGGALFIRADFKGAIHARGHADGP
ncbi:hypothetical protein U9M48_008966 [Paspalum notatum var. saurae]|uniref:Uncharacterized protein n=1 Tax=Paspalum notatum var. saurae TaxID=547442 RepID=A0AAQ3SQG1_PASNO